MINNKWFAHYRPNPGAELRLFCFPYAGGSALIFRAWSEKLPTKIEVCPVELPGRGTRLREAPFTQMFPLVEEIGKAIMPYLDKPYALFGHSMGSLIAFELARYYRKLNLSTPVHLFVSGHTAPQVPQSHDPIYNLPDDEFLKRLHELNGTPSAVLQNKELMELLIPILRADFTINETYEYQPGEPLTCPISAFGGLRDKDVSRESMEAWRDQTTSSFSLQMFDGDHFFLQTAQPLLLKTLSRELTSIMTNLRRVA